MYLGGIEGGGKRRYYESICTLPGTYKYRYLTVGGNRVP